MSDCLVDVRDATVVFGREAVLRDVSLCVFRGEVVAVVGGSGSGKTTLLRLILGLQRATRGAVSLFGHPLVGARPSPELRDRCGVVFQSGALFSALTVFENVALPLRELQTVPEPMVERLVWRKLSLVGIDRGSATKVPAQLSGGMVKRVALARALVLDPELLFLDEPTSGLDPLLAHEFAREIDLLRRELSLSVVMATHDVRTVASLADRVALVADGHVLGPMPLPQLVGHPHPFVRSFFAGLESLADEGALDEYRARLLWREAPKAGA